MANDNPLSGLATGLQQGLELGQQRRQMQMQAIEQQRAAATAAAKQQYQKIKDSSDQLFTYIKDRKPNDPLYAPLYNQWVAYQNVLQPDLKLPAVKDFQPQDAEIIQKVIQFKDVLNDPKAPGDAKSLAMNSLKQLAVDMVKSPTSDDFNKNLESTLGLRYGTGVQNINSGPNQFQGPVSPMTNEVSPVIVPGGQAMTENPKVQERKMEMDKRTNDLKTKWVDDNKGFSDAAYGLTKVREGASNPSPAGDIALIFGFMKTQDPGSTVREGEFATAEQTKGVDQTVVSLYNKILKGERLTEKQRKDFASTANRLYEAQEKVYSKREAEWKSQAKAQGLDPDQVTLDMRAVKEAPKKVTGLAPDKKKRLEELRAKQKQGTLGK